MAEGVQLGGVGIFADKGSPGVGDSFGDADHHVGAFFEGFFQVMIKGFQLEGRFREIDEEGVVAFFVSAALISLFATMALVWHPDPSRVN